MKSSQYGVKPQKMKAIVLHRTLTLPARVANNKIPYW
jgi:translation initiation factor IF-2